MEANRGSLRQKRAGTGHKQGAFRIVPGFDPSSLQAVWLSAVVSARERAVGGGAVFGFWQFGEKRVQASAKQGFGLALGPLELR